MTTRASVWDLGIVLLVATSCGASLDLPDGIDAPQADADIAPDTTSPDGATLPDAYAPAGWTCAPEQYASGDGCHCECGLRDPDCDQGDPVLYGCTGVAPYCTIIGTCKDHCDGVSALGICLDEMTVRRCDFSTDPPMVMTFMCPQGFTCIVTPNGAGCLM